MVVRVEIYIKWGCFYCVWVKGLFDGKGVVYDEYDIMMGGFKCVEMQECVLGVMIVL